MTEIGLSDGTTSTGRRKIKHVVLTLHGIRDYAEWTQTVEEAFAEYGDVEVVGVRYGFFPAPRFLAPPPLNVLLMRGPLSRAEREYRNIRDEYGQDAKVSIIAHSFGTHLLTRLLRKPHIRFHRVILCGSVVGQSFEWEHVKDKIGERDQPTRNYLLNDCGNSDPWPPLGEAAGWGYGAIGTNGAGSSYVRDRCHEGGHSLFFNLELIKRHWVPYIIFGEEDAGTGKLRDGLPRSVRFLEKLPLRWLIVIAFGILAWLLFRLTLSVAHYMTGDFFEQQSVQVPSSANDEAILERDTGTESGSHSPLVDYDTRDTYNSIGIAFRSLPRGEFQMGCDVSTHADQRPRHRVELESFLLGAYEVTQEQFETVMGINPSYFRGDSRPVEQVSWNDAISFCNHLSLREGLPQYYKVVGAEVSIVDPEGNGYRLPTEAEWEYACRAGGDGLYCFGDEEDKLSEYAWFGAEAGETTHVVGGKRSNRWLLHDMHGNVFEWCWDRYDDTYYHTAPITDPQGPSRGPTRVNRGGSWGLAYGAMFCQSAFRSNHRPDAQFANLGFRVARSLVGQPKSTASAAETDDETMAAVQQNVPPPPPHDGIPPFEDSGLTAITEDDRRSEVFKVTTITIWNRSEQDIRVAYTYSAQLSTGLDDRVTQEIPSNSTLDNVQMNFGGPVHISVYADGRWHPMQKWFDLKVVQARTIEVDSYNGAYTCELIHGVEGGVQ